MATKFCRALTVSYTWSGTMKTSLLMCKLAYEFWAYCVNGGTSPTTPGGLATTTPTTLPAGLLEGAGTVLLASGTNGSTTADSPIFTSAGATFTSSMQGKYLVMWDPTTPTSTEDSIYQILSVPSATTLELIVSSGGSPSPTTLKPRLTSRTSLRYRVVDMVAGANVASTTGQYMVWQMTPHAGNPGQANSQVQWIARTVSSSFTQIGFVLSPGGTWNGSAFTDGTTEELPTTNAAGWFTTFPLTQTAYFTMVADKDFFICHARDTAAGGGSGLHVEIPQRIYSQAQDPNPITLMTFGLAGISSQSTTSGWGQMFVMRHSDNTTAKCRTLTRNMWGDSTSALSAIGGGHTDPRAAFYAYSNKAITSDALLSRVGVAANFAAARVRLRNVRFCSSALPSYTRLGDQGQYLHLTSGVCIPWDNTVLGFNLMPIGF